MQYDHPSYYRPYSPGHNANTPDSSDDDSIDTSDSDDSPEFNTSNRQIMFQRDATISAYATYQQTSYTSSPLYFNNPTKKQTTLLSIRSKDRNVTTFPTSSYFTLNTPRIYKDISQIQCVQITYPNFINWIFDLNIYTEAISSYISKSFSTTGSVISSGACCMNLAIAGNSFSINEYVLNTANTDYYVTHVISIPQGGYTPIQLVAELNRRTNTIPPFNLISYVDFRNAFYATNDISFLFNEGGLYLYNTLSGTFTINPTKDTIISNYYPLSYKKYGMVPTERDIFVAYYYPALKESIINLKDRQFLNYATYTQGQAISSVILTFQGISSQVYFDLCSSNVSYLDKIRRKYTFEYNLLNQYDWNYNPTADRIGLNVVYLNQSIRNDIEKQRMCKFNQALSYAGISASQFSYLNTLAAQNGAVVTDLLDTLNTSYATTLGIPYGIYNLSTLAEVSSVISTMNPALLTPPGQTTDNYEYLIQLATGQINVSPCSGSPPTTSPMNYGCIRQIDLISDAVAVAGGCPSGYNTNYCSSLLSLNASSIMSQITFGNNYICNYAGSNITTSNFSTFYSTFHSYASTYMNQMLTISTVNSIANISFAQQIYNKYGNLIPNTYLTPSTFLSGAATGPVLLDMMTPIIYQSGPFIQSSNGVSCNMIESCNAINNIVSDVLSYMPSNYPNTLPVKMGFGVGEFIVTNNIIAECCPFQKHNLYLQLNIDRQFNRMDVISEQEHLTTSPETFINYISISTVGGSTISVTTPVSTISFNTNAAIGESNIVLGKILFSDQICPVGGVSQTMIQNPVRFKPALGKLDKLEFHILLDDQLIPLEDIIPPTQCMEWDAVFQIDEQISVLPDIGTTRTPSVIPP